MCAHTLYCEKIIEQMKTKQIRLISSFIFITVFLIFYTFLSTFSSFWEHVKLKTHKTNYCIQLTSP